MTVKKIMKGVTCFLVCLLLSNILTIPAQAEALTGLPFAGDGTLENPYLITTADDIACFRDLVNEGMDFQDHYFYQTNDIDLLDIPWTPIGIYGLGNYFLGTYNGGGHVIENLRIEIVEDPESLGLNNQGLFGQLGGVVLNLGIESGSIAGSCVGSIASHSASGSNPYIINCYSRAQLSGFRAGGIVDNFSGGTVVNCWYDSAQRGLEGQYTGTIASYAGLLIDCFGQDDVDATDFIGEQIDPRPISSIPMVTRETESQRKGVLYVCTLVKPDMLIPWEYDGLSLKFSDRPLEPFAVDFQGSGTASDPYLIQSYRDLCNFRNLVYVGNDFRGIYFRQTADIVMETDDWTPIGVFDSGNYFRGIYDGAGHTISNLMIKNHAPYSASGLFGQLAGVVANLGIESGYIEGYDVGSIASRLEDPDSIVGYPVAILNCYNKATLCGMTVGGIAFYARGGTIVNCWSDCDILSPEDSDENLLSSDQLEHSGGILSTYFLGKVYNCSTTADTLLQPSVEWTAGNSQTLTADELYSEAFVSRQNISTAMAQVLFGNQYGVQLMEWTLDGSGTLRYSSGNFTVQLFQWLNEFLPVLILFVILLAVVLYLKAHQVDIGNIWKYYPKQVMGATVILGVVSFFVDCAACGVARNALNLGNIMFLMLCNSAFLFCVILAAKNITVPHDAPSIKRVIPLLVIMGTALALEVLQFNVVPRYDANVYYGSLVLGGKLFRLDFFTYWGAFNGWREFQGSALVLAPLEFLFPGQLFGLHLSNVIITEVTLVIMYCLLRECYDGISPLFAAFGSAMLLLCPYQLGLFTHLNYDSHLVYYAVWLLYAYKRKNMLLVSFCGFLLSFTKVTGFGFYAVFLAVATLCEVVFQYRGNLIKRVRDWWKWSKCLLWVFPAILYLFSSIFQEWFTIQVNTYLETDIHLGGTSLKGQLNTILQSLVFGFRWLFVLLILIGAVLLVERRKELKKYVNQEGLQIILAAGAASAALVFALLFISFPLQIPRYTAPLNVWYVLCLPLSIRLIFSRKQLQKLCAGILTALLLVQTYWTVDLSIPMFCEGFDTGKKEVYKMALYGRHHDDHYGYNMEFNFYNDLIEDTLRKFGSSPDAPYYVLDVGAYELELNGVEYQYPTVWNTKLGRLNYDWDDPDAILLKVWDISTQSLLAEQGQLNLSEHFYLFVPARIDGTSALWRLEEDGYNVIDVYHAESIYGTLTTYELLKVNI